MAYVEIKSLIKRFGDVEVIRNVDLEIAKEEFTVFVGPSGCGKTTLLRSIAGLEAIDGGEIHIDGRRVDQLQPAKRGIAMVFQNYALYPHMTVHENMSFGLRLKKVPKDEIQRRVADAARILGLDELLERKPKQLSGGQRQRVAMGRAIVRDPKVFLFDEPLSNLDAKLRVQMRTEIKKIHQKVRTTTVYVTHDQVEAMTLADRVVVMNGGRIEQVGAPNELYHRPATKFVAGFIGSPAMNMVPCDLEEAAGGLRLRLGEGIEFPLPEDRRARYAGRAGSARLLCGLRPEHLFEQRPHLEPGQVPFQATPEVVEPMGNETLVYFPVRGIDVCACVDPGCGAEPGKPLKLVADLRHLHLIDENDGRVL